ncbi:MAG: class I SAM-dependent methyltransferase [Desulfovibrionales bacterium]
MDEYARIAPLYDFCTAPFLNSIRRDIQRAVQARKFSRLLEVGCGTGRQLSLLSKLGIDLTGVDVSPAMIRKAKRQTPKSVTLLVQDASELPFSAGSFDCVLLSLILHEMNDATRLKVLTDCRRVLDKSGEALVLEYLIPSSLPARASMIPIHAIERMAGKRHYANFIGFLKSGALNKFLQQTGFSISLQKQFFWGTIGLVSGRPVQSAPNHQEDE